jgi:hypothetical protein
MPPKKVKINSNVDNQLEESSPSSPPAIPSLAVPQREILVTLPVYSSAVKKALKDGKLKIGDLEFQPGVTYRLNDSPEIQAAIKEGMLIKTSGSFGPKGVRVHKDPIRIREKPKDENSAAIKERDLL